MKKLGFLALSLAILAGVLLSAPKIKATVNEIEIDKANTEKYEAFLAENKAFYDNTFYNGVDISGLTPYEAVSAIEEDFEKQSVEIVSDYPDDTQDFSFDRLEMLWERYPQYHEMSFLKKSLLTGRRGKTTLTI